MNLYYEYFLLTSLLLNIIGNNFNVTLLCQSNYFQNECCSMTSRRAVMCEVILVKVQCVTVKLLILFYNK